ncbi:hypothetical protein B9T31_04010 [Acinetobacter sp. ANC 4558]|uniref:hypothetical protein n=1 Tax=Acinetobacter sp. ANC 4558 TaxID=1977876 RepID=UPI000A34F084|nr:hypothetical protein [Acinetobacter sp. ANC 4558]OTG87669.1 hypothetical protein B9T31_04010 [Acinetobacter sp. ANC 4558]
MIDVEGNILLRNLGCESDNFSQFKEFNCENELTPIQARMYYLMLNGLLVRGDDESLYGWCGRIGLSNSTIFGIFKKNNKNMHLSVAKKIAAATGADIEWVQKGIGEPFNRESSSSLSSVNFSKSSTNLLITSVIHGGINKEYLEQCFESTDGALKATFLMMQADDKAEFILKFYTALLEEHGVSSTIDPELFILAVFTIEIALYYSRQTMSPKNKSELIVDIYDKYHVDADLTQNIKSDFDEYRRNRA